MSALLDENRCHTFRHTYEEQIVTYARAASYLSNPSALDG